MRVQKVYTYNLKLIYFIFFFIFNLSFSYAQCNFDTQYKIDELVNYKNIKNIKINLNAKKFIRLNFKAIYDRSQDHPDSTPKISNKFKKYLIALVTINYQFGSCSYESKVKLAGKQIDHLSF